jgi:lysyl-tRNA synthetase class 2
MTSPDEELSTVQRDRREKLERLIADGIEPYVRQFDRSHTAAEAVSLLGPEPDAQAGPVSVAGRLIVKRVTGGMTFALLRDGSGDIQLVAQRDVLGEREYERFVDLDPGDLVGASGRVRRTRRGEPSVWVESFQLLSKSLRPLPEKWHGLKDQETRYRQRYVDLIVNQEVREAFIARSRIISAIRALLDSKGFLEVETPVLHEIPGGGHALPFVTHYNALHRDFYLRIALELYLKRLVVGGLERVYEIGRVFRNEGVSPKHNPEFTMLECYQAYADYEDMMTLTEEIVEASARTAGGDLEITYQGEKIDLRPPYRRARMVDLVREATGLELHGTELADRYEEEVEPKLRQPTFVMDYPVEVSPLARRRADDPRFVSRRRRCSGRRASRRLTPSTRTTSARSSTGCRRPAVWVSVWTGW